MKQSAIRDIFDGKRGDSEQVKLSDEYKKIQKEMYVSVDSFLKKLSNEQRETFEKTFENMLCCSAVYAEDHFVEGFKLGLPIGIECTGD